MTTSFREENRRKAVLLNRAVGIEVAAVVALGAAVATVLVIE